MRLFNQPMQIQLPCTTQVSKQAIAHMYSNAESSIPCIQLILYSPMYCELKTLCPPLRSKNETTSGPLFEVANLLNQRVLLGF
jgi:hypothetical protein